MVSSALKPVMSTVTHPNITSRPLPLLPVSSADDAVLVVLLLLLLLLHTSIKSRAD